ncbi:hypothetical protein [Tepidimicrobium xylanilyticum]|uniref:Uncharacterized protein n=1 Tax=Tepidimicrobium xylanilyticum TaxID=1123352 RepID=A0A1H2Q788_9FIRM|nr:hypothetical protein [Tepidimicrobium xylanilyticum]SDW02259.1 hypothetical protein SAMN05660923_00058 [Tepidimicrobium xylanilyticum]
MKEMEGKFRGMRDKYSIEIYTIHKNYNAELYIENINLTIV